MLSENQFGFREGLNTEHASHNVMIGIYHGLNLTLKVSGLLLVIKNAFDTVNRVILLEELHSCGARGDVFKLFNSYLQNRKQCVKVNPGYSEIQ